MSIALTSFPRGKKVSGAQQKWNACCVEDRGYPCPAERPGGLGAGGHHILLHIRKPFTVCMHFPMGESTLADCTRGDIISSYI